MPVAVFAAGQGGEALARLAYPGQAVHGLSGLVGSSGDEEQDDASVDALLAGCDGLAVVLSPGGDGFEGGERDWLDVHTLQIYTVLTRAVAVGISQALLVSSMEVYTTAPTNLSILPIWVRRPSCDPSSLGPHLAEFCCEQFAGPPMETTAPVAPLNTTFGGLALTVLRLGTLAADAASARAYGARWWCTVDEATIAVRSALPASSPRGATEHVAQYSDESAGAPIAPTAAIHTQQTAAVEEPPSHTAAALFGARGMMGPPTASALVSLPQLKTLVVTDLSLDSGLKDTAQAQRSQSNYDAERLPPDGASNTSVLLREVDITDEGSVREVVHSLGTDGVVINCAVVRLRRSLAFRVNVLGTAYAIRAAVACGQRRFINTGPSGTVVGPGYRSRPFHHITESVPSWPGTGIYYMTKALGHQLTAVYAANHPSLSVLTFLFGGVNTPLQPERGPGHGFGGWASTLRDCAAALKLGVAVPLATLPSRHETFFIGAPSPDGWLAAGEKAGAVLGWHPQDRLEVYYTRSTHTSRL